MVLRPVAVGPTTKNEQRIKRKEGRDRAKERKKEREGGRR
jgi:hypothetical protein